MAAFLSQEIYFKTPTLTTFSENSYDFYCKTENAVSFYNFCQFYVLTSKTEFSVRK